MHDFSAEVAAVQQPRSNPNQGPSAKRISAAPQFGPELRDEGGAIFRLFAPAASSVGLALDEHAQNPRGPLAMRNCGNGWHELAVDEAGPGTQYRFVLPDGFRVPDPASRYAPLGVHGPSELVDPKAYCWHDEDWHGRPWSEAVLYELHIGTFTPEGTFRAAAAKLDFLRDLGITGVQLMCLCAFAGQRSWGYDGVQIYAPDATYGRPDDLKAFIDAAHARGIMVILDVVYNHFGSEGNYIPRYFPEIFSKEHKTAWGPGLNFDGPGCGEVREFIVENALHWTGEFHVDGLRIDASHALIDNSPHHILNEISERVHATAGRRDTHLILENEQTIAQLLKRDPKGQAPYSAQWNHAVDHILGLAMNTECDATDDGQLHATGELARALAEGFFAGDLSCSVEDGASVPPTAFVSFIQTHDLIGNRVFGERVEQLASPDAVRAIAAVLLLLPQIPMLFMGEEWAASTPFPYFSDYGGELAKAVRQGRAEQMMRTSHVDAETLSRAPDPQAESTFLSAKLQWGDLDEPLHAAQVDWYRRVLAVRRERILPLLDRFTQRCGTYEVRGVGQFECEWALGSGGRLNLAANLCSAPSETKSLQPSEDVLWLEGTQQDSGGLGPWSVRWQTI
ncbi:MAG TPA: malto-oligosyltrehalose trehalohydrolase [Acidobacteriaceae bacterium]|nr:malto-oligosyltrehalose trehalohydrolase [Acidobacteriaceae bacterium]